MMSVVEHLPWDNNDVSGGASALESEELTSVSSFLSICFFLLCIVCCVYGLSVLLAHSPAYFP